MVRLSPCEAALFVCFGKCTKALPPTKEKVRIKLINNVLQN